MAVTFEVNPSVDQRLLTLVGLIYETVDQPELWPAVLDRISEAVHGEGISLFAADYPQPLRTDLIGTARIDPAAWLPYFQHYSSLNILAQRADRMFPMGTPRYTHEAVPDSELEQSEFYNDFARHIFHYSVGLAIPLVDLKPAHLTVQRSKRSGPFTPEEGAMLVTLLPHLSRALALYLQFCRLRSKANGLGAALKGFDIAVFGLDGSKRVAFMNHAAQEILRLGDGLILSGVHLKARLPQQDSELQFLVSAAVATGTGDGCSAGGALLVNRKPDTAPFRITVMPFTPATSLEYGALAALVFVHDPERKTQPRQVALRALYGLTPAECRIADHLAAGHELSHIAEIVSITVQSARFQLKSIFRKTGTNRQSQLIRVILSLPANGSLTKA